MYGKVPESRLIETIPLMSTSAIWGQSRLCSHPESPQDAPLDVAAAVSVHPEFPRGSPWPAAVVADGLMASASFVNGAGCIFHLQFKTLCLSRINECQHQYRTSFLPFHGLCNELMRTSANIMHFIALCGSDKILLAVSRVSIEKTGFGKGSAWGNKARVILEGGINKARMKFP